MSVMKGGGTSMSNELTWFCLTFCVAFFLFLNLSDVMMIVLI